MKKEGFFLNSGGFILEYQFLYPETRRFFGGYLIEYMDESIGADICITKEFMEENRWLVDENEESLAFLEFQSLMLATGNTLLLQHRALFHGAALIWKEHAWILTAPSGTGKTTQLRHWRHLLKKEAKVINGDKPFLECREDGSVWVHSSPWRGKEKLGLPGMSARLGGIIFLEQGKENQIEQIDPEKAVLSLFMEFVSFPENTEQIRCQAQILQQMLDAVPVWKLTNLGDEASARMTLDKLTCYLEERS